MAGIHDRLERLEESARTVGVARLRTDLARATDAEIAEAVAAFRRGDEGSDALFGALGLTEESVTRAVGAVGETDPATLERRMASVFVDVLREPRRGRIRRELERLGA